MAGAGECRGAIGGRRRFARTRRAGKHIQIDIAHGNGKGKGKGATSVAAIPHPLLYPRQDLRDVRRYYDRVDDFGFLSRQKTVQSSRRHLRALGSSCAERGFVYNGRELTDDRRTDKAIKAVRGKRMMLNAPKGQKRCNMDVR